MSREPRVTMAKEILQISQTRVTVDYDFRNDSDDDVTTVVAFPIPDYDHDLAREGRGPSDKSAQGPAFRQRRSERHLDAVDNRRSELFARIRAARALECVESLRRSDPAEEF